MFKIAHRGYCKFQQENTIFAFQDAVKHGFNVIELDIQLDKNNQIIIYHDNHIDYDAIDKLTYEEIIKRKPHVPLLSTFFKEFDYKAIQIYLDLKGSYKLAETLHRFLIKYNIDTSKIWFASYNLHHLDILFKSNSHYQLGFISNNDFTLDILTHIISKYNIQFVCFCWTILNKETIAMLQHRKINVFYYTLKSEKMLHMLQEHCVNGIVSDILLK